MPLIQQFPSGPFSTNSYLVACPVTKQAAIIDPAPDSAKSLIDFIQQHALIPQKILLTHSHWDHIADIAELKKHFPLKIYIHPLDASNLKEPGIDQLPFWIPIAPQNPDFLIEEDDTVSVGQLTFHVIHTPGHSPGCVCFYEPSEKLLFSGDTLFKGSIGNLSFPTSEPNLMWHSLNKLAKLDPQTKVFPGHGPQTTIKAESWLSRAEDLFG